MLYSWLVFVTLKVIIHWEFRWAIFLIHFAVCSAGADCWTSVTMHGAWKLDAFHNSIPAMLGIKRQWTWSDKQPKIAEITALQLGECLWCHHWELLQEDGAPKFQHGCLRDEQEGERICKFHSKSSYGCLFCSMGQNASDLFVIQQFKPKCWHGRILHNHISAIRCCGY